MYQTAGDMWDTIHTWVSPCPDTTRGLCLLDLIGTGICPEVLADQGGREDPVASEAPAAVSVAEDIEAAVAAVEAAAALAEVAAAAAEAAGADVQVEALAEASEAEAVAAALAEAAVSAEVAAAEAAEAADSPNV